MSEYQPTHSPDDHEALIRWIEELYAKSDLEVIRVLSMYVTDMRAHDAASEDLL
jgi:hypothetical protein